MNGKFLYAKNRYENLKESQMYKDVDSNYVEEMLRKFKKMMVATNYYWMIWVMLDLRNPMFPQDTLHFINQRAKMYLNFKSKLTI